MTERVRGAWGLPVQSKMIPQTLRTMPQWIVWRAQPKSGGKPGMDKIPVNPLSLVGCAIDNPSNFTLIEPCENAYESSGLIHGIGFCLSGAVTPEGYHIVPFDFDHCVSQAGDIEPHVEMLLHVLNTYTEISPSGTGVRAFVAVRGECKSFAGRHLQVFSGAGYVTVTGHRLDGFSPGIRVWEEDKLNDLLDPWRPVTTPLLDLGPVPTAREKWMPEAPEWFMAEATEVLKQGDRSTALAALTARALREVSPEVVLWWVEASDAFQVALDHRRQDHGKALEYVWRHHCSQNVVTAKPEDFDNLGVDEPPSLLTPAGEVTPEAAAPEWIVGNLIETQQIALLIAEESVGKTFVGLDIARSVAQGAPWCDFPTTRGRVGYFCAEGPMGFRRRLRVLEHHHGSLDGLYVTTTSLPLTTMNRAHNPVLSEEFHKIAEAIKELKLSMIFIDTFSTYLGACDENSNSDMSWLLAGIRRHLVEPTGCSVVLVHHTRKDGDVFRGASALSNNADVRFELRRHETVPMRVMFTAPRLRDAAQGGETHLNLEPARVGDIESLVVLPVSEAQIAADTREALTLRKKLVAESLVGRDDNPPSAYTLSQVMREKGLAWATKRTLEALLRDMEEDETVTVVDNPGGYMGRAERWVLIDPLGLMT